MSAEVYLWVKALHIIAVIAWMAALLYLPRLFAYHCQAPAGSRRAAMLAVMERRLLRAIMTPAMVLSFIFGGVLFAGIGDWSQGWIHVKLVLVLGLAVIHGLLARWRKAFEAGKNRRGEKFYRVINEVPTVLMIGIVILAVVRPF